VLVAAVLGLAAPGARADDRPNPTIPVAGAFVYPVGDELDFTKPHEGESSGFHISDSYLVRRGKHGQRAHKGVDLANGRGGSTVRAIASGVVVVSDARALIKVRRAYTVKVPVIVNGKRVYQSATRYRNATKWRTGWGNYVVIRHMLQDGDAVHSLYAHLKAKSVLVKKGDVVSAGQPIAQVGKTGRASSPHLHLEVRKALQASSDDSDYDPEDPEEPTIEDRSFALLATIDPMSFLSRQVRRFEDLDPRSWQGRYALAACRDGIVSGDEDEFEPDDSITRADFYRALSLTFGLNERRGRVGFSELRRSLGDVLDSEPEDERAGDHLKRSEALEILLRCLDMAPARGQSLAAFERERLCADFNRVFAGPEAADRADRAARDAALAETAARRKAAEEEFERALRMATSKQKVPGSGKGAAGATPGAGVTKRVKRRHVQPVEPVPRLDAGFEAIANSDRNLSRAEACLLLASAFRLGSERTSALEQAATRVATASSQ